MAGPEPQPQQRAGEAAKNESNPGEGESAAAPPAEQPPAVGLSRCRECSIPLIRPGRDLCHGCELFLANSERRSS